MNLRVVLGGFGDGPLRLAERELGCIGDLRERLAERGDQEAV